MLLRSATTAACSKASAGKAASVPCDDKAIAALAADLDKANGIGVELSDTKAQAEIAKAKTALTGKQIAFTGCTFQGQGNDVVSFGSSSGAGKSIDCAMKGGADAVTEFRHAAMKIGQSKLKLDVSGTIALGGRPGIERLRLSACEIATHE